MGDICRLYLCGKALSFFAGLQGMEFCFLCSIGLWCDYEPNPKLL